MRIAVPTNDGTSISPHFGRSAAFLIFETRDGRIQTRELRSNTMQHSHDHAHEPHGHAAILQALAGCDAVICAGMGARAAEALQAGGVETIVFTAPGPAESAVTAFLAGVLPVHDQSLCRCSH
jgi:predicted Fe-Mo cluster-binding NifX family protein